MAFGGDLKRGLSAFLLLEIPLLLRWCSGVSESGTFGGLSGSFKVVKNRSGVGDRGDDAHFFTAVRADFGGRLKTRANRAAQVSLYFRGAEFSSPSVSASLEASWAFLPAGTILSLALACGAKPPGISRCFGEEVAPKPKAFSMRSVGDSRIDVVPSDHRAISLKERRSSEIRVRLPTAIGGLAT